MVASTARQEPASMCNNRGILIYTEESENKAFGIIMIDTINITCLVINILFIFAIIRFEVLYAENNKEFKDLTDNQKASLRVLQKGKYSLEGSYEALCENEYSSGRKS